MSTRIRCVVIDADVDAGDVGEIIAAIRGVLAPTAPVPAPALAGTATQALPPRAARDPKNGGGRRKAVEALRPKPAQPKPRAPKAVRADEPAPKPVTHNGVTVAGREVSYGGGSVTLAPKGAALVAVLARVMPSLLDRARIGKEVWNRSDELVDPLISQTIGDVKALLAEIGLKITNTRGIGYALSPAE